MGSFGFIFLLVPLALSLQHVRQSSQAIPPADMASDYIPDYNAMFTYISENISFRTTLKAINDYCTELYNRGYIDFFAFNDFQLIVKNALETVYTNVKNNNMMNTAAPTSANFRTMMGNEVQIGLNTFLDTMLQQSRVDTAVNDGISVSKVTYVLLSSATLFREDVDRARQAYDNVYSAYVSRVKGTEPIKSLSIQEWIAAINQEYQNLGATTSTTTTAAVDTITSTTTDTTTSTTDTITTADTTTSSTTTDTTTSRTDTTTSTTTTPSSTSTTTTSSSSSPSPVSILQILPSSAPIGFQVTIYGSSFSSTTSIMFGSTPASHYQIKSDTEILVTVPDGIAQRKRGVVDVTVTTPSGTSAPVPFLVLAVVIVTE